MSKKSKLKEIHRRLKEWNDTQADDDLFDIINELDAEISTMDDEDNGGNNPSTKPKNP